ncbi:MAG: hypothetical protein OQK24_14790, partial [Magnetovibrio sp.]|nr:hypothetical protein [Magnetovibrio sp.]
IIANPEEGGSGEGDPIGGPGGEGPGGEGPGSDGPGVGPYVGMIVIGPGGQAITFTGTQGIIIGQGGQTFTGNPTDIQGFGVVGGLYGDNYHQIYHPGAEGHFGQVDHHDPIFERDPLEDPEFKEVDFVQTIVMPGNGGVFAGGSASTNYYFAWQNIKGAPGGHYVLQDDTAAVNQISLDGMVDVQFKVSAVTNTSGNIQVYKDYSGSTQLATIDYSGISQFLLSNVVVASLSGNSFAQDEGGDILKLSGLNAGEIGYGIAATHSADVISVSYGNAIIFGNDGGDTFNVTATSGGGKLLGGNGADTFNIDTFTDDWDLIGGADASADVFDYATLTASVYAYFVANGTTVRDNSTSSTKNILHNLGMDSHDTFKGTSVTDYIHVYGGSYGTIEGGDGDDVFQVSAEMFSSSAFTSLDGGSGSTGDSLTVLVSDSTTFDLSSHSAKFSNMNTVTISGSTSSSSGINVTGQASIGTTFDGSGFADTMTGGSAADVFQGNAGADTITSGGGADVFKYNASTEGNDLLQDFTSGTDKFYFATSGFNGANNAGSLDTVHFVSGAGATAADANDYYIYDTSSKILFYDADGSGSGSSQIAIATLQSSSDTVVASDIVMV